MDVMLLLKMDVVPSERLVIVWLLLLVCGATGFLLCRRRRALLFVVLPLASVLSFSLLAGVAYSHYGSGTFGGVRYSPAYLLSYLGVGVAFLAPFAGAFSRRRAS